MLRDRQPLKFAVTKCCRRGVKTRLLLAIACYSPLVRGSRVWIVIVLLASASLAGQSPEALPQSLTQMIETERAFAARALVIGWKQAFLEYFAPNALGFDQGQVGLARDQLAKAPDPPPDLQLIWEPRFGDISGSGELGYLTGPVRNVRASRDGGKPRYSNYTSVWKRQRDGSFKVVMDVGINTPGPVSFAPGFTRAPQTNRFTGDYDDSTPPLGTADGLLNAEIRRDQARAYRPNLTSVSAAPSPEHDAHRGRQADPAVAGHTARIHDGGHALHRGGAIRRSGLLLGHLQHRKERGPGQWLLRAGLGPGAEWPVESGARRPPTAVTSAGVVQ